MTDPDRTGAREREKFLRKITQILKQRAQRSGTRFILSRSKRRKETRAGFLAGSFEATLFLLHCIRHTHTIGKIEHITFKMPRVVPDQRSKFENEEFFRKLSRECEVKNKQTKQNFIPPIELVQWRKLKLTHFSPDMKCASERARE